jgi:endonuclease/exonuclease/phosphatase family metal-dependent hydrolase
MLMAATKGAETMNRREFITTSTALAAASVVASAHAARAAAVSSAGLCTISYNILACRGFPDTDANRERLARAKPQMTARVALELGLYAPDLITLSESPSEQVVADIAARMGMNYAWFPGGWEGDEDYPGGFPGTILTRLPIVEKENCPLVAGERPEKLFTRHWCRALIKTDAEDLAIFSAHLHPHDAATRKNEVTEILRVIEPVMRSGQSLLLQGDLNHTPDGPEYARWVNAGLVDALAASGNGDQRSFSSIKPTERIDYVWAAGPIAQRLTECHVLFEGGFRTNPDDPQSIALSDHLPVLARFGVGK